MIYNMLYSELALNITLHSLSTQSFNLAANHLVDLLTQTETIFPGTNLKLIFISSA